MSTVYDIFNPQPVQPQNQNAGFLNSLQQFARTMSGNPEQIVRGLVESGRMSQEQFTQLGRQASQIQQMFGMR